MMLGEGLGLLWFAHAQGVAEAIVAMVAFGLFTHMACGATYALVPFVDRKALGGVAGIVGAGGNVGAVAAGFLMKGVGDVQQRSEEHTSELQSLMRISYAVLCLKKQNS